MKDLEVLLKIIFNSVLNLDGIEGSGSPPIDDNAQIDTQTNINNIEEVILFFLLFL